VIRAAAAFGGRAVFVHCGALKVGIRQKLGLPSPFDMRYSNPWNCIRQPCNTLG